MSPNWSKQKHPKRCQEIAIPAATQNLDLSFVGSFFIIIDDGLYNAEINEINLVIPIYLQPASVNI